MNPSKLGDSYDIVKRFFCDVLRAQGYDVFIDPMFTGTWNQHNKCLFYQFLGAKNVSDHRPGRRSNAILVDPDTGVWERNTDRQGTHISFNKIAELCQCYRVVFVFDQSFARNRLRSDQIRDKLHALRNQHCSALYYDSHACFLLASCSLKSIRQLRGRLVRLGLPENRLVMLSHA